MLDRSSIGCYCFGMNKLSTEERKQVVAALVEGNSLRSTTRMTGVHRTTNWFLAGSSVRVTRAAHIISSPI